MKRVYNPLASACCRLYSFHTRLSSLKLVYIPTDTGPKGFLKRFNLHRMVCPMEIAFTHGKECGMILEDSLYLLESLTVTVAMHTYDR